MILILTLKVVAVLWDKLCKIDVSKLYKNGKTSK